MRFRRYISLGDNCEVGLQFRRIGYEESSFFRFTYCSSDSLIKILSNDFREIFEYENLVPSSNDMIRDTKYDIYFHTKMLSHETHAGRVFSQSEKERRGIYLEEREKHLYLIRKWMEQISANEPIAYFVKSRGDKDLDFLDKIVGFIDKKGGRDFSVIYLVSGDVDCSGLDDRIVVERLSRFAPDDDVQQAAVGEYDEIFRRYGLLGRKMSERASKCGVAYDPSTPLISLHLPKTAGTAFQEVLKKWFGDNLFFHYTDYYNNTPPEKHDLFDENGRFLERSCVHGHFAHNEVFEYYGDSMSQFISIIRDPFEAHVSMYFYVKKLGEKAPEGHPLKIKLKDPGYSVTSYLRDFRKITYFWFFYPGISLENYKKIIDEKFVYIGLTEKMQESVDELASRLGFQTVKMPVMNESKWDEEVPLDCRKAFEQENELAVAVYKYVKQRFF